MRAGLARIVASRRICLFVVMTIAALARPASAAEKVVLQLRWDHQFQFAGYYAAKWMGYYDEAGLDVEIRSAFGPDGRYLEVIDEVADGRADFGIAAADILKAQNDGAPLVIVKSVFQHSPVAFYTPSTRKLESPGDLVGLRIGIRSDGFAGAELRAMLRAESIDPAAVTLVPIRNNLGIQDIAAGLVDAASGFTISAGWYAARLGLSLTSLRPQTYGVDFYGDSLFANRRLTDEAPDLVERFAVASMRGWEYALDNANEIAGRIARELPRRIPLDDAEGFNRFQAGQIRRLAQYPIVELGHTNPARWEKMHDALKDAGLVRGAFIRSEAIFDSGGIRRARFERRMRTVAIVAGVLVLSGLVAWLVVSQRSRTERRRMQNDLRMSEERLRAISDNSPYFIYLGDTSSRILSVNKAYERFYGVSMEEIVGDTRRNWISEDARGKLIAADREVVASRRPVEVEYETKDRNGVLHYLRALKFPVLDADGSVQAVGGIATDITEHVFALRSLEQQRSFFQSLVDSIPARVSIKDAEGRYVFASRMLCEDTGKKPEEVIGKTSVEAFGIPRDDTFATLTRQAIDTGKPILGVEKESELRDGSYVSTSFVPILGPDGEFESLLTISFDVTQARQRDAQLQQSQKMEAVGQLTGGVAHDFNNLLTVVLGNLEILQEMFEDNPEVSAFLTPAINNARRGAELTHRLLAFSRKQALAPAVIDPGELITGLLDLLRRTLGATIEIRFSGADGGWRCRADPAQLESAILNLAINARDAMPEGGRLTISTRNVSLDEKQAAAMQDAAPGDYVVVSVADTGTGIEPEDLARVFEPFFTTKEVGKGSGLGLSMVYGFAKQSGGHVTIASETGVGTEVKVYLPRTTGAAGTTAPAGPSPLPSGAGETVLVVDDNPDVRALASNQLRSLGYVTLEAEDGASARAVAAGTVRIDLLLTDIVLPGGESGFALAAAIAANRPDMAVLYMSGYSDEAALREGPDAPPGGMLGKPFRRRDLAARVRDALDRPGVPPGQRGA